MIPAAVLSVRAELCAACPTPCHGLAAADWRARPCAACPLSEPRWFAWGCAPAEPPPERLAGQRPRLRGLGDAIAIVADPIAKAIHLDKTKCGCAARQQRLNELVPFTKTLPNGD